MAYLTKRNSNSYDDDCSNEVSQSQNQSIYLASESETNSPSDQFSSSQPPPESVSSSNQIKARASLPSKTKNFSEPTTNQTPYYIPIAPLPIFRGGSNECPVTHLTRFAKICRANFSCPTVDVMVRIFPVTLENEAALWYDLNIDPYPSLSWEEIRSLFFQAYDQIDQLRSELTMIKQSRDETVRAYFLRLQWILKRWPDHGLQDNVLKGVFIDGLRKEFKDWTVAEKPSSLNDALRLAFGFEKVKSVRAATAAKEKAVECGFCGGGHEEKGCEVRERMRKLWVKSKEEGLVRMVSVVGKREEEGVEREEEGELVDLKKKGQCQCWKHKCWKKKLERSKSLVVTGNFNANKKF
ncbi:hypothetical protein GBA52_010300 [Prunus armeniaca]|nr:hypothetical protein GBA52_010300 [Prunus armeniaca]